MKKDELIPNMDWIVTDKEKQLHEPCQKVNLPLDEVTQECIQKMYAYIDTCFTGKAKDYGLVPGIGIAAPQLGYYQQLFYINFIDDHGQQHRILLANPRKIAEAAYDTYLLDGEGCLSVKKDYKGYARRKAWIVVEGYDVEKKETVKFRADGIFGICLQHEMDHLKGLLYYDRIDKVDPFRKLDTDKGM